MRRRHARCLETELAAATTERDQLKEKAKDDFEMFHGLRMKLTAACGDPYKLHDEALDDIISERDQLRAKVERLGHLEAVLRSSAADMTAGSITAGGVADLRAENERLRRAYVRPDDIRAQLESATARAERAEAELKAEQERCDKLLSVLVYADQILDDIDTCSDAHKPMYSTYSQNVFKLCIKGRDARRAAIDAAMKEGAK